MALVRCASARSKSWTQLDDEGRSSRASKSSFCPPTTSFLLVFFFFFFLGCGGSYIFACLIALPPFPTTTQAPGSARGLISGMYKDAIDDAGLMDKSQDFDGTMASSDSSKRSD